LTTLPTVPAEHPVRSLLEQSLTRLPGLYAWLIARRSRPNLEKIIFLSLVRRGETVVDAGANTGYYTLLFSRLVGRRGRVHAFEPVPPTFAELRSHVERAGRSGNVALNNCALADEEKATALYLPGDDHGQAALTQHTFGSWASEAPVRSYPCRATTLDAYVETAGIDSLGFVKCDVEGAELLVLRGASRTIRRFRPLLFLEVSRHWTAGFSYEPVEIARFLESLGYSRFFLVTDRLLPLSDVRRDLAADGLPDSANLLCADGTRHGRRLARLRPWLEIP
jgi:FkbM family methyltransferase